MSPYCMVAFACGLSLFQGASAWLPVSPKIVTTARASTPRQPRAAAEDSIGGGGRPDLVSMKRSFVSSMDNKLIMEYVMELRSRKTLLLSSLEKTGGIITDEIYPIMEELALVNPSSGCGSGSDKGKSHYCAMLRGHWIAASTIIPNVPYVYGQGEKASSSSSTPNGDGPTCTLGDLVSVISAVKDITGGDAAVDYDAEAPVRPLRARISALINTVKDGEMPTVVAVAGFAPAAEAKPVVESGAERGVGGEKKDNRAEGGGRVADDGAVRGRGKWGVMGGYHLRWEFDTMNVDLGGDRIARANGGEGASDAGRDVYEFFLDQNMMIVAWKDAPKKEDAVVFVRDELPR